MQARLYFACVPVTTLLSIFKQLTWKSHCTVSDAQHCELLDKIKPSFSLLFPLYYSSVAKIFTT